jgi:hypothetical protein
LTPSPSRSVLGGVPNDAQFPIAVAEDLLSLTRALYAHYGSLGPAFDQQVLKLRGIGSQLHLAIEKAERGGPGTLFHRAAWLIAEQAVKDLGELVGDVRGAALIEATGGRLLKRR